jgi:hypothetical protein
MEVQQALLETRRRIIAFLCGWNKRKGHGSFLFCISPFVGQIIGKMILKSLDMTYLLDGPYLFIIHNELVNVINGIEAIDDLVVPHVFAKVKDMLYVVGNLDVKNTGPCIDGSTIREYNPWTASWRVVHILAYERHQSHVFPIKFGGKTFLGIFGGWLSNQKVNICELVDCSTWTSTPLPTLDDSKYIFDIKIKGDSIIIVYTTLNGEEFAVCWFAIGGEKEMNTINIKSNMIGASLFDTFWMENKFYAIYDNSTFVHSLSPIKTGHDKNTLSPYDVICFDTDVQAISTIYDKGIMEEYFKIKEAARCYPKKKVIL